MFVTKILLSLTIMAAALIVHVAPAAATGPDCSTGINKRGYDTSVRIGKQLVLQAWASSDQDPSRFEVFVSRVGGIISTAIGNLPNDASDYTKCRAKGLAQGACDGFEAVQDLVVGICVLDGEIWGQLAAELYCSLSVEFGGLEAFGLLPVAPSNLCGESFEEACHGEFESTATVCEPGVTNACLPFTTGGFVGIFTDWQTGLCTYEIL